MRKRHTHGLTARLEKRRDMAARMTLICALLLMVGSALGASATDDTSTYESDMAAFVRTVDDGYPFLALKGIGDDWADAKQTLVQRAKHCTSDEDFLKIVIDAIRVLRDGHLRIRESRAKMPDVRPQYYPGVSFLAATEGRVTVMHAPRNLAGRLGTGTVVTKIDGTDARRYLEQRGEAAWNEGGFFSSPQRARLFECRLALRGEQGKRHTISYRDGEEGRSLTLECQIAARGWPHTYNLPGDLKRVGRSFFYTKLADDVGYMYLRRVDASVPQGIDEALRTHPNLKGWIVDLRGNSGGGYDRGLIERIKGFPRPVAVLIDAGCISAGETLARDFRAYAAARLFGSTSAGSSSAKRTWSFPSGIASIQLPVRSRWRHDRKPIEFNGVDPDVQVEAVPAELKAGNNSAILRAREYIDQGGARGRVSRLWNSRLDGGRLSDFCGCEMFW
ncbi:MAG: S41 family peptidase [Planctomycetota bacterium]